MNRVYQRILGGFGGGGGGPSATVEGTVTEFSVDDTVDMLKEANGIVIVPGYGMAAQAQHSGGSGKDPFGRKKQVRFAIHPVAGRLPGHMNVPGRRMSPMTLCLRWMKSTTTCRTQMQFW